MINDISSLAWLQELEGLVALKLDLEKKKLVRGPTHKAMIKRPQVTKGDNFETDLSIFVQLSMKRYEAK